MSNQVSSLVGQNRNVGTHLSLLTYYLVQKLGWTILVMHCPVIFAALHRQGFTWTDNYIPCTQYISM